MQNRKAAFNIENDIRKLERKYNEGQEEKYALRKQEEQTFKMKTPAACHRAGAFHVGWHQSKCA